MNADAALDPSARCPRCGEPLIAQLVRTIFWHERGPAIVEDIPAQVCHHCVEQYYDDDVSDALRRLAEEGFPADAAAREITVSVFSLSNRIRRRAPLPDDSYLD